MPTNVRTMANTAERFGLAMSGLACGTFVAAAVSHAEGTWLQALPTTLLIVVAGGIGFYFGVDTRSRQDPRFRIDPVCVLCPSGTVMASTAALIAVILLVFDVALPAGWLAVLAGSWLLGTLLQITAGVLARSRRLPLRRRPMLAGSKP